jgi:hypothetical protein
VYDVAASAVAHRPPVTASTASEERNRDLVIRDTEPASPVEVALEVHHSSPQ